MGYVSSPAAVSKSTRHLPAGEAAEKSAQALAAISAASAKESGNSVGVAI